MPSTSVQMWNREGAQILQLWEYKLLQWHCVANNHNYVANRLNCKSQGTWQAGVGIGVGARAQAPGGKLFCKNPSFLWKQEWPFLSSWSPRNVQKLCGYNAPKPEGAFLLRFWKSSKNKTKNPNDFRNLNENQLTLGLQAD